MGNTATSAGKSQAREFGTSASAETVLLWHEKLHTRRLCPHRLLEWPRLGHVLLVLRVCKRFGNLQKGLFCVH